MSFKPVSPRVNFVEQEEEVLRFWDEHKVFKQSLDLRSDAERYVFFEGPPTANAKPGLHHLLARYFKDLFPRYKTMQGYLVERKAGWDTHGLPVEISVEKELGLKDKNDIEKYGVAAFNAKARESVWEYKGLWEDFTKRSGFWLDLSDPYITYDPKYIESVWWILARVHEKGLLYRGHKVVPFCTRCGTALSSHEVAQGYQEVEDVSVFVKFPVKGRDKTYILSWTTTPWTLPGNVALAVNNELTYVEVEQEGETLILARDLVEKVLGENAKVAREISPTEVLNLEYERLFPDSIQTDKKAWYVLPADFVTAEDGTGVVHTAVMYGEDDYRLGEQNDLPKVHTVGEDGLFLAGVPKVGGMKAKERDTEELIINDLKQRGLLLREMPYKHEYPFCWRCGTPLLYYATNSWFIAMSKMREQLMANNKEINWIPSHIQDGRFGEWVKEVKDWAISRNRYWGTPLPLWVSADGDVLAIESYEQLKSLAQNSDLVGDDFDPHRPKVDEIVLVKDGKEYRRVPEVLDVWFDSGAVPFAQWHYPFENKERIDEGISFPADYISEAIDQTRGWFYTLLAVSTLLDKPAPYKNVICLGHILDKYGKKMSKSKGNVIDPWEMFEKHGSDVLRWYFYTINQPGLPKNFDEEGLKQITRRFVLTLWNTYSFFIMYANIDDFNPKDVVANYDNVLDKWIVARKDQLVVTVTKHLEEYDPMNACLAIEAFVDDLSNWYVRRSRRRFWKSEDDTDKMQAYSALYSVLMDTLKLMAPLMPFLSEAIYQNLKADSDPASVHLTNWPKSEVGDENILAEMARVRELVEDGLNQREQAGIKVRQPLRKYSVDKKELDIQLIEILKEEINVKEIELGSSANKLDLEITDELRMEGLAREIVRQIQVMRKDQGFEIQDRIQVIWDSESLDANQAFGLFKEFISQEVLADSIEMADNAGKEVELNGNKVRLEVNKI